MAERADFSTFEVYQDDFAKKALIDLLILLGVHLEEERCIKKWSHLMCLQKLSEFH